LFPLLADQPNPEAGQMSDGKNDSAMPSISGTVTAQLGFDGPLAFQLSALCEKLQSALCQDVPPRTRERYVAALYLTAEFFKEIGFPLPIYHELIEFTHALNELGRGTIRDFLRPFKAETRPTDASDIWQARALVAIAVETMTEGGFGVREACRRIAECFPNLKDKLAPRSKAFASTVGGWHSRLSNGTVKDAIASGTWRDRTEVLAKYREAIRRPGTDSPAPQQIALVVIRGALVLAEFAGGKSERKPQRGFSGLHEARGERAFLRPPEFPTRALK
jgi:hypothetical protein